MRQRSARLAVRCSAVAVALVLGVAATACARPEPAPGRTLSASAPLPDLPSPPTPTRLSLTQDDSGRTLGLVAGGVALLRVTGPGVGEAVADGPAVTVVPVEYESDPGYREWEVRAVREGTAVVRAGGGTRQVSITFKVVAPAPAPAAPVSAW
ncbi:hypothetical protein GCM10010329_41090 [Streptomyces spiroverticillatus]|uniref:Uncharacterized protein n=1 Tax=Streptomyces finlayi TaxID=67296 RepID=A0A918WZC3_9ACTN|nr:hypothetical protein [Streptomyces finlayi]GHA13988.1 hypothetical protein GCM10010329_41090 [Streptomyces spiroverticillatus]GHC97598.1 hypothetical protein GCM10010334_39150 [Streptomyces finlayi]